MVVECPKCEENVRVPSDHDTDEKLTCPTCRAKFRVEFEEDEPSKKKSSRKNNTSKKRGRGDADTDKKPKKQKANWIVPTILGCVLVVMGLGGLIVFAVTRDKKPVAVVNIPNPEQPPGNNPPEQPPREQPPREQPPRVPQPPRPNPNNGPDGLPIMPPEIKQLFESPVARKQPVLNRAVLTQASGTSFTLPPVATVNKQDTPPAPKDGKLTLGEVKKAVVFVKVAAGEQSATGSGFVIQVYKEFGLIATNTHVVKELVLERFGGVAGVERLGLGASIEVVFDSGTPTEKVRAAELIAADPEGDIALLRVAGLPDGLKPIDPAAAIPPKETLPVLICGFPFGEQLATARDNPNVTIGKGSVSSLRLNPAGQLAAVQIDGNLNPGNSGGPILDADGRLIGIAVAAIKGTGIGMAIPTDVLKDVLNGRVLRPVLLPLPASETTAPFRAVVPVADPNKRVKSVSLLVGGAAAVAETEPNGTYKPLGRATRFDLRMTRAGFAEGDIELPITKDRGATIQLVCTYVNGTTLASQAVPYLIKLEGLASDADSISLTNLIQQTEQYEGQVIALRANLLCGSGAHSYTRTYEIYFENTEDKSSLPHKLRFLTSHEIRMQMLDTLLAIKSMPVRASCLVGKKGANGITPVRVVALDTLGPDGRIKKTLPYEPPDVSRQVLLNPEKFIGQTVSVEGQLRATFGSRPGATHIELSVMLSSGRRPLTVMFEAPNRFGDPIRRAITEPNMARVRLTGKVEDRVFGLAGPRYITVDRIELLGPEGETQQVIE